MALAGFSQLVMVAYPNSKGHFHPSVNPSHVSLIIRKITVAPVVYLVAVPVAFINGWAALAMLLLIPVGRVIVRSRKG
jgi:uncharacterized membrane protein